MQANPANRRPTALRTIILGIAALCGVAFSTSCKTDAATTLPDLSFDQLALIPVPNEMTAGEGGINLADLKGMSTDGGVSEEVLERFSAILPGRVLPQAPAEGATVRLIADQLLGEEAYRLEVLPEGVKLYASKEAGYFYGLQTLRQLMFQAQEANGVLAAGTIVDAPRYAYRAIMLDIARHFHKPAEIRRLINIMSGYKMNALHLHLTDDQGWRIEIKGYPRLTEYGGSTQVGGEGGGFLTQADYEEIVRYAAEHYVTIVPEVDVPGHTQAALASYPELACKGANTDLYEGTEVGFSTLCIGQPAVTQFMQTVIAEVAAITPGPYLHLGGDESRSTTDEDFDTFMKEIEPMVRATGKRMIGWDEVANVKLDGSAIVQMWHSEENAQKAIAAGHKVIMSPSKYAYVDMQYDSTSRIGLHWASYIDVDRGYDWDPTTVIGEVPEKSILGVEAPLWSETVVTREDIDYLMFPRLLGIAEIAWSQREDRDWETYRTRLAAHAPQMEDAGIDYYKSPKVDWDKTAVAVGETEP